MLKITTYRLAEKPHDEGFYQREAMDVEPVYYAGADVVPEGEALEALVRDHVDDISGGNARVLSIMDQFVGWGVVVSTEDLDIPDVPGLLSLEIETIRGIEEDEEVYCPVCFGGCHQELGTLGNVRYWRCSDCGVDWGITPEGAEICR